MAKTNNAPKEPTTKPNGHDKPPLSVSFPFFAPENTLPAPLPTIADILASKDLFPCIFQGRSIRRVGPHYIVKHGNMKLDEAANMHFVATHCAGRVAVPKLYAAFHNKATDSNFIIMEYIEGMSLDALWDSLGETGRSEIAKQLRQSFAALRSIPSQGYYGRLGAQPYDDIFLGSSLTLNGPFTTEAELNEAFYQRYASLHPELAAGRGAYYREVVFPSLLTNHPPIFTHGDLQAKNILVRNADGLPFVIDWECSAFYPSYWEYTNALWTSRRWSDDWFRFLGMFLDEHVAEFKCVENLLGDLLDAPQPGV